MSLANAAHQTTETQGTGTLSLSAAAVTDRELLRVALARATGDGAGPWTDVPYVVAQTGGGRELGIGTVTAGSPDTLTRTVIVESTNGGAAVDWGPGTKDVIIAPSAQILQKLYAAGAAATAGTLVERDVAGRARVADPDDDADIATKGYVDDVGESVTDAAATAAADADTIVANGAADALAGHTGNTANPHEVTKEQVGLGNVLNFAQLYLTAATVGAAGSIALSDGTTNFIFKWGTIAGLVQESGTNIAFPQPFPTACLGGWTQHRNSSFSGANAIVTGFHSESAAGATVYNQANMTVDLFWFAIGH